MNNIQEIWTGLTESLAAVGLSPWQVLLIVLSLIGTVWGIAKKIIWIAVLFVIVIIAAGVIVPMLG